MRSKAHVISRLLLLLIVIFIGVNVAAWTLPLPSVTAQAVTPVSATAPAPTPLGWPIYGESAFGIAGYGLLGSYGNTQPMPTASVAKIITALTVLNAKPLQVGQSGPLLTMTPADVTLFQSYLAEGGSVVPVTVGEQISEYQVLQAMLLPSANNMADTLAIWAFGSLTAYKQAATEYIASLGLHNTVIGSDASGFQPSTTSTASDLVTIGLTVLKNNELANIVSERTATLPVAGLIKNYNFLLGQHGIIGIKTGNNSQDSGVYLVASVQPVANSEPIVIVAAIMGALSLEQAENDSVPLLTSVVSNFHKVTVVHQGEVVGTYRQPATKTIVDAVAASDVSIPVYGNNLPKPTVALQPVNPPYGSPSSVGLIQVANAEKTVSSAVKLDQPINKPPWYWRYTKLVSTIKSKL